MILGISADSAEANAAFARKFNFPYKLLCDVDRTISVAYGALEAGSTKGPRRITYVIEGGKVILAYHGVKDAGAHPKRVLDDILSR